MLARIGKGGEGGEGDEAGGDSGSSGDCLNRFRHALVVPGRGCGRRASGIAVSGNHHIYPEIAAAGLWTTATDVARSLIELQLSLQVNPTGR
jgi:hypothetical protein